MNRPAIISIIIGIAAVALGAFFLWPTADKTIRGEVTVDGAPVPIGTISIVPLEGTAAKPLSLPIIDGSFRAKNNAPLIDGAYSISVVVGNELGSDVPQIAGSPLAKLNGSRFRTEFKTTDANDSGIVLRFTSKDAIALDGKAALPDR